MNKFDFSKEVDSTKPNVLFIHGFGATKAFVNKLKLLERKYNIIALSLPQKATEKLSKASIEAFANHIKTFVVEQKLTNFYILGHSLGGAIISYLHDLSTIKKFILCAPLHPEALFQNKQMHHWLLPTTIEEARASIAALVYNQDAWKGHAQFVAENSLKQMDTSYNFFLPMVENEILNPSYLKSKIAYNYDQIKKRAVIIAAYDDLYIKWDNLQKTIKQFKIPHYLIHNCGHVPTFEKPIEINDLIVKIIEVDKEKNET